MANLREDRMVVLLDQDVLQRLRQTQNTRPLPYLRVDQRIYIDLTKSDHSRLKEKVEENGIDQDSGFLKVLQSAIIYGPQILPNQSDSYKQTKNQLKTGNILEQLSNGSPMFSIAIFWKSRRFDPNSGI